MNFEELEEREEEIIRRSRHNMAPGQKLTLADIRQVAPDSIHIFHIRGDLRPERHFSFVVTKGDKMTHYEENEVNLSAEDIATLKNEFQVQEMTLQGTPSPAAIKLAEREWEEWEKKHGKRLRSQPEVDE